MESAVEFLESQYKFHGELYETAIEQAKEMEKEQKVKDMQEYAEFCIMCDRKQMPLLLVEDWYKHYKS